VNGIITYVI